MARRKTLAIFVAAVAVAAAGCKLVSDPPMPRIMQEVEFLRGCWVSKAGPNGPVTGFLRLLPDGRDGLAYQGYLQAIEGSEMKSSVHVSFARDGSSMTIRQASGGPAMPQDREGGSARPYAPLPEAVLAMLPKAKHRAGYAVYPEQQKTPWMIAEGDGESLAVYQLSHDGENPEDMFRGERDGCD
jgi:hypothetical protein